MTSPPPCFPEAKWREFFDVPSRLGRRCCMRVICLWGDRDGLIIRRCLLLPLVHSSKQFLIFERWREEYQMAPLLMQYLRSSRRGSRIHTDGFPKRASTKAHASSGVWKGCSPGKFLKFFTPSSSLISGFLSHSDRILASVELGIFFHSKYMYLWPIFVKSWKQVCIRAWVLLWFLET